MVIIMINKLKMNLIISSFILFGVGTLLHFSYDLLNNNFFVGLIAPVNESVFEHLKLALYPIFFWWLLFYLLKHKKYSLDKSKWFFSCFNAMISSIVIIISIHYVTKYGFGIKSVIVDIISLYIAILLSQLKGYKIYNNILDKNNLLNIIYISSLIILFIYFSINPPKLPMFKDEKTKTYGIYKLTD